MAPTQYYYFTEQPYTGYDPAVQEEHPALRLTLPNSLYDSRLASELYNRYHDEYQIADEARLRRHHDQRAPHGAVLHAGVDQHHRRRVGQDPPGTPRSSCWAIPCRWLTTRCVWLRSWP